jgi:predicted  nucleic acid-binding Zn-ribbon protein
MNQSIFDVREILQDKKIYKSFSGKEFDVSFRPAYLDEVYKQYANLEKQLFSKLNNYTDIYNDFTEKISKIKDEKQLEKITKEFEKETDNIDKLTKKARETGINFIVATINANNKSKKKYTKEQLEKDLDAREFGLFIHFIMDLNDKKK